MNVEKKIHLGYQEWINAKAKGCNIRQCFGKYQYIYSSQKTKISLIQVVSSFGLELIWEIYCIEGDLFDDVERFKTKKEAEKRIKELLKPKIREAQK